MAQRPTSEDASAIADRVEPVPFGVVPASLRSSAAGVGLFKEEFRAAQRLRNTESIFIPEVVRTTHPPELRPHGVASNPAPTYVSSPSAKRPSTARKAIGPGHLNRPPIVPPRAKPPPSASNRYDFSESFLNRPNEDYLLTRQLRPETPVLLAANQQARGASPPRSAVSPPGSPSRNRPVSALGASFQGRISHSGRPLTPSSASLHPHAAAMTLTREQAAATTRAPDNPNSGRPSSPLRPTPLGATSPRSSYAAGQAQAKPRGSPPQSASAANAAAAAPGYLPRLPSPGVGAAHTTTVARPMSAARSETDFIRDVDEDDMMANEPRSRPVSAMPNQGHPPGAQRSGLLARTSPKKASKGGKGPASKPVAGSVYASTDPYSSQQPGAWNAKQVEGFVEVTPGHVVAGAVQHLRAASASLRKYAMPPSSSAISPTATTYARKPQQAYKVQPGQPTPSERIATNYTPKARGLSPRTIEFISPGGIKPHALGPLPKAEWAEVDVAEVLNAVPEADGVITATRKHMAFMPLELFDNMDYEMHEPEEWVQLGMEDGGTRAATMLYNITLDKYDWEPCRVVAWDEGSRAFQVQLETGKSKMVKRLNLRFEGDDPALFARRVEEAKQAREVAEAELRYFFYLDSLAVSEVIHTYNFYGALQRAALQVRHLSGHVLEGVGKVLVEDGNDYYVRAVRRAQLEYRRLDPMEESRLKVLRLPPRHANPPAPYFGMLPVTDSYEQPPEFQLLDLLGWASMHLFVAVPQILRTLMDLERIASNIQGQLLWCLAEKSDDFKLSVGMSSYTSSDAGLPPFPLINFEALQHSHLKQCLRFIELKLMEALNVLEEAELLTILYGPQVLETGTPAERSDPHLALLRLTALRMADAVHSLLLASAEAYVANMEKYMKHRPMRLEYGGSTTTASSRTLRLYPGVAEIFSCGAFLRIRLMELEPGVVGLDPPGEEILDVAAGQFDDMADVMAKIENVFEVGAKYDEDVKLCDAHAWARDKRLDACRERVRLVCDTALERAHEIGSLFEDAAGALAVNMEEVLSELSPVSTPLESYSQWISKIKGAAQNALDVAPNEVFTGLLLVDTSQLKDSLVSKAESMVGALLAQLLQKSLDAYNHVCVRCEAMSKAVMEVAGDVQQLLELQALLGQCEAELDELRKAIGQSKERDAFRVAYRHPTSDRHLSLAVRAQSWPKDMMATIDRAYIKLNRENLAFQDKLRAMKKGLADDLQEMGRAVMTYKACTEVADAPEYAHNGTALQARLVELGDVASTINEQEGLFGWEPRSEWPQLPELEKELEPYASLWQITHEFNMCNEDWLFGDAVKLDTELIDTNVTDWFKKMSRLAKSLYLPEQRSLAESVRDRLEEFKTYVPVINCLTNPGMRGRHWDQISRAVGFKVAPGEDMSLSKLLKAGILGQLDKLQEVADAASREHALERQLDKMYGEWAGMAFELAPWKNTGGFILKGSSVEEAQLLLDDHTIKAQAMASSPAAQAFLERIEAWVKKLTSMQDIIDAWLLCQQKWMYLGPVYGSEEIAKQMPKERHEFQAADGKWRSIMAGVQERPEILQATDKDGLLNDLKGCNHSFANIEKSLNAYLDSKKMLFPRFFFLSNDELIEILSEAKDPLNIQPFAKKIFEAVNEFEFNEAQDIVGLVSVEGEKISMGDRIETAGETNGVERWLLKTESVIHSTLHGVTKQALQAYPSRRREQWILEWPGQVVIAVGQTYWTKACGDAIAAGGMYGLADLAKLCTEELMQEVRLVRGELTHLQRCTLGALVVVDVHARDVVQEMVDDKVATVDDFSWQSRLRYYWEDNDMKVRMLNAEAQYGYEYLGNSTRLVITPLTDRCYRTLLGAHHMNLGGAPAGPAGTGKTETTKDLAKAVAIQCVVFNCSDGLDYLAMAKFFKGLAACGAWACFDEFNRIELEVLSVVAQQVLTIQRAKAAGKKRFVFEGVDLPLVMTCNVFITMNPGYAGRSELPDNLKALFRDVAMMVPDYAMIAEIMLYSYGYMDARSLAQKLVMTYRLCSEQLSRQDHYDYGMRAVMAVLRAAGNLKRRYVDEAEDVLMLRAINDVNLPKFLDEDVPLFKGILSDLFPGIQLPAIDYADIKAALTECAVRVGLQPLPSFLEKAIQLYEMIIVRHGLMLVGYSFGMKTSAIRVLGAALGEMCSAGQGEQKVKLFTINPKSITLGQLYGQDDPVSKEWSDGVLAVAFRTATRDTSPDRKWLVLDGPVDAIWIENMNTVLDDNKKLCLNSGEIIAMQGLMNMVFEVADLAVASPATVSRCGMVYMQPSLLGWRPVVQSWLQSLPEAKITRQMQDHMMALFDWLVPPLLRLVTKDCKMPVPMQDINLVQSLVRLFQSTMDCLLNPEALNPPPGPSLATGADKAQAPPFQPPTGPEALSTLECLFVFSLTWALGGSVDAAGRAAFSKHLRAFIKGEYGEYGAYVAAEAVGIKKKMPDDGSVYDYVYDVKQREWLGWMETVASQAISPDAEYSGIIVTTVDVVRITHLINTLVTHHMPMLLVGPTGTGKSVYIKEHLANGLDRRTWVHMVFNFSAQTSANMTQDIIDGKLDKRRKGVYGPPVGKHAVVFVDDLNMPQVEKYGAQPPIELLRQFMDHGGWYDRHDLHFRKLTDVQFISAMGPPGGGRNNVTNRFLRHFHMLSVSEFDDVSKTQIFSALVDWWFTRCKYPEQLQDLRKALVAASLDVYSTISRELLPTPAKTHYIFNLRDLSKVFQGMQTAGDTVSGPEALVRLWVHEVLRVFHDRLVDDDDRDWIGTLIKNKLEEYFRMKPTRVLERLVQASAEAAGGEAGAGGPPALLGIAQLRRLMFADFLTPGQEPAKYVEVLSDAGLTSVVKEYLGEYNAAGEKPMHGLVLFQFALEHVCRICRVLKQPGGHMLLVGVGGSGRQSLTRLAAFMEDFKVFQIEISSSYSASDWRDDLKKALRHAGEKHKNSVFLFSDSQILNEGMVEDISNLLNTGEVPNLFDTGEVIAIGEAIRTKAKQAKMDGSRADLYNFFVQGVRRNLHIVLCFSPVGDAFRERLRKFPSLITCTTIDWFTVWPDDALQSVADQSLQDLQGMDEDLKQRLAQQCMQFHKSTRELTDRFRKSASRHFYVTPTSYLQLLDSFRSLLTRRQGEVLAQQRRYEVGLEKLLSTESSVKGMQEELEALKPRLIVSSQETDELMKVIETQTAEADIVKATVKAEEAKALEEAAKVQGIKDECESDLAQALPAYNAAIKALDTLTKNDISEVKGMKSPPMPVKLVMEAVCILKGLKPTRLKDAGGKYYNDYWETSKKMLGDMAFLDSLRNYDKDNIAPEVIEALQPLLKHADFQPAKIKKVSQAAFGLCNWVRAMDTYDRVAKVVRPKRAALKQAEEELAEVMKALKEKQDELARVEARLADLSAQLATAKAKKEGLEADVALCSEKLDRAQKLIGGLGGEKARWTQAAVDLGEGYMKLIGDMLLSAGHIAYLGAFTAEYRHAALSEWSEAVAAKNIPCSPNYSFIAALGDPVKMRQWAICGLPKDDVSAANGITIFEGKRWPLAIDPQGQANKWIRNMEGPRQLLVLKPTSDPAYLRHLQAALPLGRPVLLENLGEGLDASLEPVLLQQTFKQSGVLCVRLGDSVVEWGPGFRLYLTTKLRNPHYAPEVCTKLCLLNFMITPTGLEDQLLGLVVAKERPDLEEDKNRVILQSAENQRKLKEIEDDILRVLSSSEGNILDDGEAVNILQASKKLSDEIALKQKEAEKTEAAIDRARVGYQPIARHASVLFFVVAELANIDPMYQYSLAYFFALFTRSIEESRTGRQEQVAKRLQTLQEHFTFFLYTNVCRSLFEKDKLLFAFSLAAAMGQAAGTVAHEQYKFLLTGALSMDNPHPNPAPDWLSDQAWSHVCELDLLAPPFQGLRGSLEGGPQEWRALYDSAAPHTAALPGGFSERLDAMQRLLVLRCIVPNKLVPAIQAYVSEAMGPRYVAPQEFKLGAIFNDSAATVPLIFVLSFGSDPMADLLKFADERRKQVETVSLGQGQGPIAEKWITQAIQEGFWVVLQNCHLAKSFLPRLEVIIEKQLTEAGQGPGSAPAVNPEFRLWLTSYPSDIFPVAVLENGLKITTEPPKGLRAGIERIYKSDPLVDPSFFEGCTNPAPFKNLLFALAFFHCVVSGRRQYGPVGWNIPYAFNENDLRISARQLRMFLDQYEDAPLAMLKYTAGECNYGGKVTDAKDRRTLMTLLERFYCEGVMYGDQPLSASGLYVVPEPGDHPSYLSYLSSLPLLEEPEVFGLHSNANITRDLQETKTMLDALLATLASSSSSGGGSASGGKQSVEDQLHGIATDILDKLPPDFDLEAAGIKYPVTYLESMNTVLVQELGRANVLLVAIRRSLKELRLAVKGQVVMSSELEKVSHALLNGKVPELWLARSFPSLKPLGPYVKEVVERCEAFQSWLDQGPPVVFWISGFFFTQAFLTGAKQNYARKYKIPIDLIDFDFEVHDGEGDCSERPPDGVYVQGMFLEAAAWDYDTHLLGESHPKVLFVPMPPMLFLPAKTTEFKDVPSYNAPLYKTSERRGVLSTTGHSTNFVCDVRLPSDQPEAHWIARGVALLTSLDS